VCQPTSFLEGLQLFDIQQLHSFNMRFLLVSLFISLYASIVAATPGEMGFSIGVVVVSFERVC
jgi:hypothetical protein